MSEYKTIEDAIGGTPLVVNMRLTAGGIRELHWHQAAEWAIMTYGTCRVTVLDAQGRPYVADVKEGDLWYFPPGAPEAFAPTETDCRAPGSGDRDQRDSLVPLRRRALYRNTLFDQVCAEGLQRAPTAGGMGRGLN